MQQPVNAILESRSAKATEAIGDFALKPPMRQPKPGYGGGASWMRQSMVWAVRYR